jgi:hypothetical protein
VSFQLSILKILAGQDDGRASIETVKQHLALYYTSGPEWPARMTRIASRATNLDIFGKRLVERDAGCWIITAKGREVLDALEQLDRAIAQGEPFPQAEPPVAEEPANLLPLPIRSVERRSQPRQQRLKTRTRR